MRIKISQCKVWIDLRRPYAHIDGLPQVSKGSSLGYRNNHEHFDVAKHSHIVQVFIDDSTICISFSKYVIFHCFDSLVCLFSLQVPVHLGVGRVAVSTIKPESLNTWRSLWTVGLPWNLQLSSELVGS